MKKQYFRVAAIFLCLCLTVGTMAVCAAVGTGRQSEDDIWDAVKEGRSQYILSLTGIAYAGSYGDVFSALSTAQNTGDWRYLKGGASDTAAAPASTPAPEAAQEDAASGTGGDDYSGTNVQVEGVDEGDIVKTDGSYIYVLHNLEVIIYRADGADTREISRVLVGREWQQSEDGSRSSAQYPFELYVSGDRMAVLSSCSESSQYEGPDEIWRYEGKDYVNLDIYDISNIDKPIRLASLGQDGYNLSSRMKDGRVYVVSNYYVYNETDESDPGTFVPRLYSDGKSVAVPAGSICIMPRVESTSYTVISVYDLDSASMTANQSMLGGGSTVYMNHDNLFVADSKYQIDEGEPYTDGIYTVVSYDCYYMTDITRFALSGDGIRLAAAGSVFGSLNDQFSLDEFGGYLRLVTTVTRDRYKIYTDEEHGWSNYEWNEEDSNSANALYVLDENMEQTGSITGLAEDERIYSARFNGDIGYFVTFHQVDPLFAADLSDPANPVILSALKIPGFSEYLHVWTDGRLFGLGRDADEESGAAGSMKLSMFDTADPTDVTELQTLILDADYSVALYNHKAILVSYDKNLIGFPTEDGYAVYGYSDGGGFVKKASLELASKWYGNARGLFIGDYFYIVTNDAMTILDMDTFTELAKLDMAAG